MALWTPSDLATAPALWLKADALALNNNDPVAAWNDSSPNARNWAQATEAKKPTYKTSVQNGLPGVLFDGTADVLTCATMPALATVGSTLITVIIAVPTSGGYAHLFATSVGTGLYLLGEQLKYDVYTNGDHVSTIPFVHNVASLYSCLLLDASLSHFVDGTAAGVQASADRTFTPDRIGNTPTGTTSYKGYVLEFVIFNSALSTENRQLCEGYLAWKWGTNGSLPVGHPYKNAAPATGPAVPVLIHHYQQQGMA